MQDLPRTGITSAEVLRNEGAAAGMRMTRTGLLKE
jgi:hypothetical protein